MKWCWKLVGNYGVAIILFTLATKIVLLPISIWIQKNSILMVKIQPEVNFIKANNHGNMDAIADEQSKLFKRSHYHPMLSIIPLILQIVLLLGVVYIIYHPMSYLFGMSEQTITALANHIGANTGESSFQLQIIDAIKNGTITASTQIEGVSLEALSGIVESVKGFNTTFLGLNLSTVPTSAWGWYVTVPILAGASSWLMCWTQNRSNVIQHEQGKLNQYGIMALSVALSLYLGLFVPVGIALYWIASNLMSIAQMYLLNVAINPKKYVDYDLLEKSRVALANAKSFGQIDKKDPLYKEMKRREKQDYKKFKHIVNKHIVIYSEKSGFYKYYKDLIDELLKRSNLSIHYVTNDYNDQIFKIAEKEPRIKPYYISLNKTAILMMLVETDMFIMTTPDLNKYYLKRSYLKKDIEYIYVPHDTMSSHMGFKEGAFDAFDTILCCGPHFVKEIRETEKVYNLKPKTLVEFGFPLLDDLVERVKVENKDAKPNELTEVLIAPSWQEDNLLESCIDDIIKNVNLENYHLTIRPHPEFIKRYGFKVKELVEKYKDYDSKHLTFELDFSTNKSIFTSDILITDWSGIAAEFCFATGRPAIFVNTKMKVGNPNWQKINFTPVEIDIRNKLGRAVDKEELVNIDSIIKSLLENKAQYKQQIETYFENFLFNHGTAAKKGADYILNSLKEKRNKKTINKENK